MSSRAIGDVRPSQIITSFGPGAIVDLQTMSVIVAGIDDWRLDEDELIHEPRLQQALGVKRFFSAKPSEGNFFTRKGTVPTFLFPRYQVCSNSECGTLSVQGEGLYEYDEKFQETKCKAPRCKGRGKFRAPTLPAPFVVMCPSGHIDDFPWREYVHRGPTTCTKRMHLFSRGETGTVSDLMVVCDCKKEVIRSVGEAFGPRRQEILGECSRRRPWLGTKNYDSVCGHKDEVRAMLRGATNGWFPILRSALSIKEAASPIGNALKKCPQHQIDKLDSVDKLTTMMEMDMFPSLTNFVTEDVWHTIEKQRGNIETDEIDLRLPEWEALREPTNSSQGDNSDFFLEQGSVPGFASPVVQQVVLVRKLLEVRALTSFTRIDYANGEDGASEGADRAPIYRERRDWLPAVEVRGEGIFIELNEDPLRTWEQKASVRIRANAMEEKYKAWAHERGVDANDFPGARYVLLHTLAHVLIRQLSLDCGYSASSVRERIYSSDDPKRNMAGILLYTASPDSEGSLGGLVDLGSKMRFPDLLRNALVGATRCSSDPLCADHQPDVHATINGAGCHACVLQPETSCEAFNRFLDRNFLVPTIAHSDMAFFSNVYGW
jgi:uncharacterized protein DUF1998